MSQGQITLTQYSDNIAYCRMSDGADPTGTYTQNDTEATTIAGTPFSLWASADDLLYVGKASTFAYVGIRLYTTAATYGAISLWYSIASTAYTIKTATTDHTLTIETDVSAKFKSGYQFRITGSTGNDGIYTCDGDSTYSAPDTTITVVEVLPDGTDDGTVAAHSIWGPLTARHDSTALFNQNGYVAFDVEGDWGLSSVTDTGAYNISAGTSTSAYWIKGAVASATGDPSTAYHLMRNVTLDPPLHVQGPEWTIDRTYQDINGTLRKVDITYAGPQRFVVELSQMALNMGELQLLHDWEYNRHRIYIKDESINSPVVPSTDAYYRELQGMLVGVPLAMRSPGKMGLDPGAYYPLVFKIDTVVTQSSLLGLTL